MYRADRGWGHRGFYGRSRPLAEGMERALLVAGLGLLLVLGGCSSSDDDGSSPPPLGQGDPADVDAASDGSPDGPDGATDDGSADLEVGPDSEDSGPVGDDGVVEVIDASGPPGPDVEEPTPDAETPPEDPPGDGPDPSALGTGCDDVTSESHYCLSFTGPGDVVVVGLDSGAICTVLWSDALAYGPHMNSIVWHGSHVYACGGDGVLTQLHLETGEVQTSSAYCQGVAAWQGGFWVDLGFIDPFTPFAGVSHYYASFQAAQTGDAVEYPTATGNSRFASHEDTLYSAWHSTDHIEPFTLPSGGALSPIQLQGYDTWIDGMSVLSGDRLVLAASGGEDRIVVFDMQGTQLSEVEISENLFGLVCVPGG